MRTRRRTSTFVILIGALLLIAMQSLPATAAPGKGNGAPPGPRTPPPGQSKTPPGQAKQPPGQSKTPPGQAKTPPGQAKTPPGQPPGPPSAGPHAPVPAAPASTVAASPPGNNGTVKIHDLGTPDDDRRNVPKVCDFKIVGFGFDPGQTLTASIVGHGGPNAGPGTYTSVSAAGTDGGFIDGPISLPDGMYKLTLATGQGAGKHKVFKVNCPDSTSTASGTDTPPSQPTSPAPAAPPGGATQPTTQVLGVSATRPSAIANGVYLSGNPLVVAGGYAGGGGALPFTGAPIGVQLAVALAALAIGAVLHRKYRRPRAGGLVVGAGTSSGS